MTNRPPDRYRPTLSGVSFSAARPIDLIPPMMTSHVSTATAMPVIHGGTPTIVRITRAIEFVCVNGVVVRAATPGDERVDPGERRRFQAVAQVVHRARARDAVARVAERHAEHGLRELHGGRDEPVAPDPEERAGPARDDARGHAGDVAGADRRRQGRHERLERRQNADRALLALRDERAERIAEAANLDDAVARREEEAAAKQQNQQPRHEEVVGQRLDGRGYRGRNHQ